MSDFAINDSQSNASFHASVATARATRTYVPAIDGLRAIAILLVLVGHFSRLVFVPGGFGVTIFFVISGLLITRLLLVEFQETARIDFLQFYARRLIRLGPAFLVFIAISTATYGATHATIPWIEVVAAVFYAANYYRIFHDMLITPLGILWSLAVEEHYYFIFPLVFGILLRSRHAVAILVGALIGALAWRSILLIVLHASSDYTYMATDTRFDCILYGAVLAILLDRLADSALLRKFTSPACCAIAAIVLLGTFVIRNPVLRETIRYSLQCLAMLPLIVAVVFTDRYHFFNRLRAVLSHRFMVFIGKLSYSLYLWHYACIDAVQYIIPNGSFLLRLSLSIPMAIVVALLSHFFVERSFLTLRRRFGSHAR